MVATVSRETRVSRLSDTMLPGLDDGRGATFGGQKDEYRYVLKRTTSGDSGKIVLFVMLNPSTADERENDPTIWRLLEFARNWNYSGLVVVNLFALRSSNPRALRKHADPIGPENDRHLEYWIEKADLVVCAWGNHGILRGRGWKFKKLLDDKKIEARIFDYNANGHPRHPLYVKKNKSLSVWPPGLLPT